MALIDVSGLHHEIGDRSLFRDAQVRLGGNERVAIVGRNGAGKSTLLNILVGRVTPNEINVKHGAHPRFALMEQAVPLDLSGRVFDCIAQACADMDLPPEEWEIQRIISDLGIAPDTYFEHLSGGWKRRVLLARALAQKPAVLLLDEPTNHLDIDSIEWLEQFLLKFRGSVLFISHDRTFVENLATRVLDIDRGVITSWPGSYRDYQKNKAHALETEATQQALFAKKLSEEEKWIRQGIKARRTRNEGRVRRLKAMREEYKKIEKSMGHAAIKLGDSDVSGKQVLVVDNLQYKWRGGGFHPFTAKILRGDKIGILGPNGVGKSTLIKLLLGLLQPMGGQVIRGTKLDIAYFDQHREALDENLSLRENVSPGRDFINIGEKSIHVVSYLQDFLFAPLQIQKPVKVLSGGERNRLLLAKQFSQPLNFLILDEPSNDLDIETLELLEEKLLDFNGTALLISHDRSLINAVCTRIFSFEKAAQDLYEIRQYAGGYDDWLLQRPSAQSEKSQPKHAQAKPSLNNEKKPGKLSYKDQRELDGLPAQIEQLEATLSKKQKALEDPDFFNQDRDTVIAKTNAINQLEQEIALAYHRWEELEAQVDTS